MTVVVRRRVICALPGQDESVVVVDQDGNEPLEQLAAIDRNYRKFSKERLDSELKTCDSYGEQMMSKGMSDFYMSCFRCPFHKEYRGEKATFKINLEEVLDIVRRTAETQSYYPELMKISNRAAQLR